MHHKDGYIQISINPAFMKFFAFTVKVDIYVHRWIPSSCLIMNTSSVD